MSYPVEKKSLYVPPLEDVSKIIAGGLLKNFSEASCEVVPCPDLTQEPWGLAAPGLSGSPRVGEAGGIPFLVPFPQKNRIYDFKDIGKIVDLPDAFVIGAGAGPFRHVGMNCEIIPNLTVGSSVSNESRIAKVGKDGKCELTMLPENETSCAILLNFYACEGKTGNVLKVKAKKRTGSMNFVNCMRGALEDVYGDQSVGFGGTFRVTRGSVKMHVMPEFSTEPITTEAEATRWMKFYDMEGPLNFMSVAVSRDPGLDLRIEHTHGYSKTEGGHYHFDTTPEEIEYEGYFNLADFVYRLDRPENKTGSS